MAKQSKKLSKPPPLVLAARPKSIASAEVNEEAPLLAHERLAAVPNHQTTTDTSKATAPVLRRASSAPPCLQTISSAYSVAHDASQGILARAPSKKLQKKQRPEDDNGDNGEGSAAIPAATPTMIKEAQLALGLGRREPTIAAVDNTTPPTPSLRPGTATAATATANDSSVTSDIHWYQESWNIAVQHPINVIYVEPRELILGAGMTMQQLKRWLCCQCGRMTYYESNICSVLDCCHARCENGCTTLQPV